MYVHASESNCSILGAFTQGTTTTVTLVRRVNNSKLGALPYSRSGEVAEFTTQGKLVL